MCLFANLQLFATAFFSPYAFVHCQGGARVFIVEEGTGGSELGRDSSSHPCWAPTACCAPNEQLLPTMDR